MSLFNFTGNKQALIKGDNLKRITLVDVGLLTRAKTQNLSSYDIGVSFQLEAVRLSYNLPSLQKARFPDIKFADNLATKMAKIADVQADYPSIYANIYHQKAGFNKTNLIASVPIQNKGIIGYADLLKPYLTTGDVKLLGEDDKILLDIDAGGQALGNDDWLQIEIDYTCVISGVYKPQEVERINNGYYRLFNIPGGIPLIRDDGYIDAALIPPQASNNLNINLSVHTALSFIDAGLFIFSGGIYLLSNLGGENNYRIPFYEYIMNSLQHWNVQLRAGITSLSNFNPTKIERFKLDNMSSLLDIEISSLSRFPDLWDLRLRSIERNGVNFRDLILNTSITYLDCYDTSLNQAKVDEIITAIDDSGRQNGTLDLRLCSPPSAGLVALNNIAAKGWDYLIE